MDKLFAYVISLIEMSAGMCMCVGILTSINSLGLNPPLAELIVLVLFFYIGLIMLVFGIWIPFDPKLRILKK